MLSFENKYLLKIPFAPLLINTNILEIFLITIFATCKRLSNFNFRLLCLRNNMEWQTLKPADFFRHLFWILYSLNI